MNQLLSKILPTELEYQLGSSENKPDFAQDVKITSVATDNRDVESGALFVALAGEHHHGKKFALGAINRGAVAIIIDGPYDSKVAAELSSIEMQQREQLVVLFSSNIKACLNSLLLNFYGNEEDFPIVGVTGTNGKSSITRFIAQLASASSLRYGLMGTLGFGVWPEISASKNTTPELAVVLKQLENMKQASASGLAMEVSSHGIAEKRIESLSFHTAVFCNLTQDHLDFHGDMESYYQTKRELFLSEGLKFAIINIDDDYGQRLWMDDAVTAEKISYGFSSQADVHVDNCVVSNHGLKANCSSPWGEMDLDLPLVGDFNLSNVLAAIIALKVSHSIDLSILVTASHQLSAPPGRMELFVHSDKATAVIDFAHTPAALENVLQTLKKQVAGKLAIVFGCGGDRDESKRPLMAAIAEENADVVVVTSDNPRFESVNNIIEQMCSGFKQENYRVEVDRQQAIESLLEQLGRDDVLLIAGKGHESYQDINGVKLPYSDEKVIQGLGYKGAAL